MATPVKMPELGESITEGTITRWIKQEGDRVEADEPLFEVSTDKVDAEVPSPVAGVLRTIKVQADETVEVGAELAIIEQDGESGGEEQGEEQGEAEAAEGGEDQAESEASEGEEQAEEAAEPEAGSEEAGGEEEREATAAEAGEEEHATEETAEKPKAEASGDGQTTTVTMLELGESITEGTITRWLKQEGDQVEADEPLFEISTDKVDTEVPSPVSGVLQSIKVQADETVEVGAELAVIGGGGGGEAEAPAAGEAEEGPAGREQAKQETAEEGAGAEAEQAGEADQDQGEEPEARPAAKDRPGRDKAAARSGNGKGDGKAAAGVSPLVRRLAREHDVDLSQVKGSGSGGRVRREDVEAFVEQRGQRPAAGEEPAPQEGGPPTGRVAAGEAGRERQSTAPPKAAPAASP